MKSSRIMLERFRKYFSFDDERWNDFAGRFKRIEAPAKTILLSEGEISKKLYLIEKGCIRAWFSKEGKDLTFQFFFEGNTVASVESFRKNIPSPVAIETIEKSILWQINKKDVNQIIAAVSEIPALREKLIDFLLERTFIYMKHSFSFIKDSPEQRYLNLIKEKPEIIKRIPQHYIASYLGITSVHLSRIKGSLARK